MSLMLPPSNPVNYKPLGVITGENAFRMFVISDLTACCERICCYGYGDLILGR